MARKLKKSVMSEIKQHKEGNPPKQSAKQQAEEEQRRKIAEEVKQYFERAKGLINMGQVADGISIFEQLLAQGARFTPEQQSEFKELMRYFMERSMKRMKDYPNIVRLYSTL